MAPNSPYSASKASADLMVRAYHRTYGLPTLITRCSNNYGPYQFPEKLIPLMISNAIEGKSFRFMAMGFRFGTGSMWKITAGPWTSSCARARQGRSIISEARAKEQTSLW